MDIPWYAAGRSRGPTGVGQERPAHRRHRSRCTDQTWKARYSRGWPEPTS